MDSLGRSGNRGGLTPLIGVGLAAIVAGSLIMLSVLAQRVSLQGPLPEPVMPRRLSTAPVPGASIPSNAPAAGGRDRPRRPITVAEEQTATRVLPLRIDAEPRRATRPAKPRKRGGRGKPHVGPPVALGHKPHHPPALGHQKRRGVGHRIHRGAGHAKHHHRASGRSDSRPSGSVGKPKIAATRPEKPKVRTGPPPHAKGKGKGHKK